MTLRIEPVPWKVEITRNELGRISHVRVLAAQPRTVFCFTVEGLKRNRTGNLVTDPDKPPNTKQSKIEQPAVIADCGIPYAGLSTETLLAHGDLIAAAPDLYEALEELVISAGIAGTTPRFQKARAALKKANPDGFADES